jgi:hypothetical protein
MNARAVLACYPRGNFYPLTNDASTRHQKVTKPCFRNCSTCQSCSKAPLCLYTLRLISIQPEGTLGILRYSLVRDRPNQTTHLAMFGCPEANFVSMKHCETKFHIKLTLNFSWKCSSLHTKCAISTLSKFAVRRLLGGPIRSNIIRGKYSSVDSTPPGGEASTSPSYALQ